MESIDCGRSITETKRGGSIMKTLVKNGRIVSPEDTYEADVLIEDGVIECIGKNLEAKLGDADKVIDAKGKYVLPGGIDVHTHIGQFIGKISNGCFSALFLFHSLSGLETYGITSFTYSTLIISPFLSFNSSNLL